MGEWWDSLTTLNRAFYGAAAFFGVFFVWQMIAAFIGLGGAEDAADAADAADASDAADIDHDGMAGDFGQDADGDAIATVVAFNLVSIRSVLTFCTLFTLGTALYLDIDKRPGTAMGLSTIWGVVGMFCIAGLFYGLRKLTVTGTADLATCVGTHGSVYVTIPEGGVGEIRTMVSGSVTYVKARSGDGKAMPAGTQVRVSRRLDELTVEVEKVEAVDDV